MPGSIGHLAARFFESVRARPLTAEEISMVVAILSDPVGSLFFSQPDIDQRHGFEAARVARRTGATEDVVTAALVHDIGKRHARLGVLGRTVASLLIKLRLPLTRRMAAYRDHGESGAEELDRTDAPRLAVEFARHHHGQRPPDFPESAWSILQRADLPQRPGTGSGS